MQAQLFNDFMSLIFAVLHEAICEVMEGGALLNAGLHRE